MFQKLIKASIYLTVFLTPLFWLPFSVEAFDFNKVYLLFFLTTVGLLSWLGQMIFKEQKVTLRRTTLDFFVLGFAVIMLLSVILGVDRISGWLGFYGRFWPSLLGIFSLVGFYFLLTNNVIVGGGEKNEKSGKIEVVGYKIRLASLLKTFLISSFVTTLIAYLSLFGVWAKLGKIVGSAFPPIMTLRIFNTIGGSLESLVLFLACISVLFVVLLAFRNKFNLLGATSEVGSSKKMNTLLYVFLFLNLILLILVNFKTAWVVFFISLFLFLIFSFWKRIFKDDVSRLSLSVFLALVALFFFFYNPVSGIFPPNSTWRNLPVEVLLSERLSWDLAGQGLKDSPVLGVGISNFSYVFSQFKPQTFLATPFWQLRFDRSGSAISEMVATAGVLGILSYLLMIAMFILVSYFVIASFKPKGIAANLASVGGEGSKPEQKITVIPFLVGFVAFLVGQFLYYQNASLAFSFWLMMGLGVVSWRQMPREKTFSFKDFPEIGLVLSIIFWVVLIGAAFLCFTLGKYYVADAYYRDYLVDPAKNFSKMESSARLASVRSIYHTVLARGYLQKFYEEALKPQPDRQTVTNMVSLAVDESKRAVARGGNSVVAYEMAGVVYREIQGVATGALDWAIKSFEKALTLEPKNPILTTELGKLYNVGGDKEKAIATLNKAIALKPDYVDAQLQLAFLEDQEGKTSQAQERLENLVKATPFSVEAHFQLGRIYFNNKEYTKAIEQFQSALTLFPNHSNSLYSLGLIYERRGEITKALEMYRRVQELNPENKEIKAKVDELQAPPAPQEEEEKGSQKGD